MQEDIKANLWPFIGILEIRISDPCVEIDNQFLGIIFNKRLASLFFFRICYYFCDVKAKLVWTTFLIKERGRTSFAAFGEGRSKKRPIPVLNANELLKKTRQCYYTKSHGKNATKKKKRNICSQKLAISFYFYCHIFYSKEPQMKYTTMGLRIACIFVSKFMLLSWLYGAVILEVKRYRYTDPICAMRYRGTVFQFAIFWPLDY